MQYFYRKVSSGMSQCRQYLGARGGDRSAILGHDRPVRHDCLAISCQCPNQLGRASALQPSELQNKVIPVLSALASLLLCGLGPDIRAVIRLRREREGFCQDGDYSCSLAYGLDLGLASSLPPPPPHPTNTHTHTFFCTFAIK